MASDPQRGDVDVEEAVVEEEDEEEFEGLAEDEAKELAEGGEEGVAKGENVCASSSLAPAEKGIEATSNPLKKRRKIIPVDPDVISDKTGKEPCPYWQCFKNKKIPSAVPRCIPNPRRYGRYPGYGSMDKIQ